MLDAERSATFQFLSWAMLWILALNSSNTAFPASAPTTLYVDDDAPAGGDGLGWSTAFHFLQDALAVANSPGSAITEIRLAQGTYKPDQGTAQIPGDREARFIVPGGTALRGGYAGVTATDPDARDWNKFPTILSGDLLGNDGPLGSFENYQDNSYRVVMVTGNDNLTILEGLFIRAAQQGDPLKPPSQVAGGGLYCETGKIEVSHCVFEGNQASWGGGAYLAGSTSEVKHCRFLQNRVSGPVNFGGGLYGATQVTDSQFIGNRATLAAGGAGASGGHFTRCLFQNNIADSNGGAINFAGRVTDCEFFDNHTSEEGGAIYGYPIIVRSTFRFNTAYSGGAVRGIVTIIDSRFIDNWIYGLAGSAFRGGGTLINCEFIANKSFTAVDAGGAVSPCQPTTGLQICGPAEFINCLFNANVSFGRGGGAWVEVGQTGTFTNCTFTNNVSANDNGGAISTNNQPNPPGIAIVRNSIMWNNTPGELTEPVDVQFSCVANGWTGQGNIVADPLFVDPLGPDATPGTIDDDLRLQANSPCIDAGNTLSLPRDAADLDDDGDTKEPLPLDAFGNRRVLDLPSVANTGVPFDGVVVDIGAHEYRRPADISPAIGDGVIDVNDLLTVIGTWGPCPDGGAPCPADLNGDAVIDVNDLLIVIGHWD